MTGSVRGAVVAFAILALGARALEVSVEVSSERVRVGEAFDLVVTVEGADRSTPPSPGLPDGLELENTSQSTQLSIVNGRASATATYLFRLRALKEGRFVIPPIQVPGARPTAPVSIQVETPKPPDPADRARREERGIFYDVAVSPATVYVGEPVVVSGRVFLKKGHTHSRAPQAQAGRYPGFKVEDQEFDASRGRWQDLASGKFSEFFAEKKVLVALEAGTHTLVPGGVLVSIERDDDPFRRRGGSLFGSMFSDSSFQQGILPADPVSVTVNGLPEAGRPADFRGVVGRGLAVTVGVDRLEAKVGEPIHVRVDLAGQADLRGLKDLGLRFPPSVTVFDSKGQATLEWAEGGAVGKASFEYVIVPVAPGRLALPGVDLPVFDAAAGRYHRLQKPIPPVEVTGTPTPMAPVPVARAAGSDPTGVREGSIRFPPEDPGPLPIQEPREAFGDTFRLALGLLGAAFVVLELLARRRDRFEADPGARRAAEAAREARRAIAGLAEAGDARARGGRLAQILREYVAARLKRPAAGITNAELAAGLEAAGVGEGLRQAGVALLEAAERARYAAPGEASAAAEPEPALAWIAAIERNWR